MSAYDGPLLGPADSKQGLGSGHPRAAGALQDVIAPAGGVASAPSPASVTPVKGSTVDDAVASLLGLAEASSEEDLTAVAAGPQWEVVAGEAGSTALLRRRLSAHDILQGRLRIPAPMFAQLLGGPAAGGEVALQAAGSSTARHAPAVPSPNGDAVMLAGEPLRQLFAELSAEVADVLTLQRQLSAQHSGLPLVLCTLAPKAEPGSQQAAAHALHAAADDGGGKQQQQRQQQQQQQQQRQQVSATAAAAAAAAHGDDEPAAPQTVRGADGVAGPGRPSLDGDMPAAAAASLLAAVAEDELGPAAAAAAAAGSEDAGADPDWQAAKPKGRGRPRKRRPAGAGGSGGRQADAAPQQCTHCGTGDTPRWWNLPTGTLCNACGIWLKRHGYPRPVQFFITPGAAAGARTGAAAAAGLLPPPAATQQQQQQPPQRQQRQQQPPGAAAAGMANREPPEVEYYLINGRPKRRRIAGASASPASPALAAAGPALPPSPAPVAALLTSGGSGDAVVALAPAAPAASPTQPSGSVLAGANQPINFEAAGSRVFVVRRKLIKEEGGDTPVAALVHFGWAPSARGAHQMFGAVARFAEGNDQVSVDDYELLSDCRATATLQLRPGAAPPNWDSLVCAFVDSL